MHALLRFLLPFAASVLALQGASLQFEKDLVRLEAGPDDKELKAAFSFRNAGRRTVTVTAVTSSCGCMAAALHKKTFAPGETGTISAVVAIKDMTGPQEKFIKVATDDPEEEEPKELEVLLLVKSYLEFAPQALFWKIGEDATEQSVEFVALLENAISIAEARIDNPEFELRIAVLETGRKYRLHVKPRSTSKAINATIHAQVKITGAAPRDLSVEASISAE